jgi:hypothetical protein
LEKIGLLGVLDTLQDGLPKLQQAYLNIINLIFADAAMFIEATTNSSDNSSTVDADTGEGGGGGNYSNALGAGSSSSSSSALSSPGGGMRLEMCLSSTGTISLCPSHRNNRATGGGGSGLQAQAAHGNATVTASDQVSYGGGGIIIEAEVKDNTGGSSATVAAALGAAVDAAFRTVRQSFLQSPVLMPSLLRLVEQGGSSAVRAKALLAVQLLCRHNPVLLSPLSERRLPMALVRMLERFTSGSGGGNCSGGAAVKATDISALSAAAGGGGRSDSSPSRSGPMPNTNPPTSAANCGRVMKEPSYLEKAAFSIVIFLREACIAGANELCFQLKLITDSTGDFIASGGSGVDVTAATVTAAATATMTVIAATTPARGGAIGSGRAGLTPSPMVRQAQITPATPATPAAPNRHSLLPGTAVKSGARDGRSTTSGDDSPDIDEVTGAIATMRTGAGHGVNSGNTNTGGAAGTTVQGGLNCRANISRASSAAEVLRAAISMASQPSLRRLIIAGAGAGAANIGYHIDGNPHFDDYNSNNGNVALPLSIAELLRILPAARTAAVTYVATSSTGSGSFTGLSAQHQHHNHVTKGKQAEKQQLNDKDAALIEAISAAEQAALVALETIAQVLVRIETLM